MTKTYTLPHQQILPYFLSHIKCGKSLSKSICQNIDFDHGHFFTILPKDIEHDQLLDFEHGGIISPMPGNAHLTKTMDQHCSEFIANFLHQDLSKLAVVENYMLTPTSSFTAIDHVKMIPFQNEVYYFLTHQNSSDEIYKVIRKSSLVWHFLVVLTRISMPEKMTQSTIEQICNNATFIIASAYDGEGFIFWEKGARLSHE